MNKCIFTGYLGKKGVELRTTDSGKMVAQYTLNVPTREKGKYEFVRCVSWNGAAEFLKNHEDRIKSLVVEARYTQRKYTDKDGKDAYITEFVTSSVEVKEWKGDAAGVDQDFVAVGDEDIPF